MDARSLKRRLGVAEETVRIKKERLEEAEGEYEEEHATFTAFSKRLEEKWEQRFDALAAIAAGAGISAEDIAAIRAQPWQPTSMSAEQEETAAATEVAVAPMEPITASNGTSRNNGDTNSSDEQVFAERQTSARPQRAGQRRSTRLLSSRQ